MLVAFAFPPLISASQLTVIAQSEKICYAFTVFVKEINTAPVSQAIAVFFCTDMILPHKIEHVQALYIS